MCFLKVAEGGKNFSFSTFMSCHIGEEGPEHKGKNRIADRQQSHDRTTSFWVAMLHLNYGSSTS